LPTVGARGADAGLLFPRGGARKAALLQMQRAGRHDTRLSEM